MKWAAGALGGALVVYLSPYLFLWWLDRRIERR